MACTAPQTYYVRDPAKFGGVRGLTKDARKALGRVGELSTVTVNCGHCIACRLARSYEWSLRVMHELQTSGQKASFVTLTYDDEHLPIGQSLRYVDFQLFMHRLRKAVPGSGRFLMCGEYGEDFGRPHYHAILFNCWFGDLEPYKVLDGNQLYVSAVLTKLWQNGHTSVGEVTLDSAGYVARYSLKKVNGPAYADAYAVVDYNTGEVMDREPPFLQSSLRPGIGYDWFQRYHSDVFPCDYLVYEGRKFPVPRYYSKLLERMDERVFNGVVSKRKRAAIDRKDHPDNSSRRLRDRNEHDVLVSKGRRDLK